MMDDVWKFIQEHARKTGRFPTNREIVVGADCQAWQIANILGRLHAKGYVTRTQISERGSVNQAKYVYALAERVAA